MEDSKIVELFFARDEEAIRQTQKAYGGRLHRLAEGIVKDKQDITTTSLIQYQGRKSLRNSLYLPETWGLSGFLLFDW